MNNQNNRSLRVLKIIGKSLLVLVIVFVVVYVAVYYGAVFSWLKQKLFPNSTVDNQRLEIVNSTSATEEAYRLFADGWFYYPRLGIAAPVQWEVPASESDEYLPNGLVHVAGSSLPGEMGDAVIAGHSSYFAWVPGDYKYVFASLPDGQVGDRIVVRRGKIYFYEVIEKYEVPGRKGVEYLVQSNERGYLYVSTCVPIGTTWRRLVLKSKYLYEL